LGTPTKYYLLLMLPVIDYIVKCVNGTGKHQQGRKIGATSISFGLVLYTENKKDFDFIPEIKFHKP
jgi:hypothetical protein